MSELQKMGISFRIRWPYRADGEAVQLHVVLPSSGDRGNIGHRARARVSSLRAVPAEGDALRSSFR
jgi:hypothetical protein